MTRIRQHPNLYQINTLSFLNRLSAKYNEPLSLATVPDAEWRSLTELGFDLVWLMGIWKRSPGARRITLTSPGLREEFNRLLPGWADEDAVASPYAVYGYTMDPSLGRAGEIAKVREKLNRLGAGLILDFVPNHLAMDHPWTLEHPAWFVRGTPRDVDKHPQWFFNTRTGQTLAHGRDPYFDPWSDTVQVNFFSDEMRLALTSELQGVSDVCDGVRCDMAMLGLNNVFQWVWGDIVRRWKKPDAEFWSVAISEVRRRHPDFMLMAEVYWGLDGTLRDVGFSFTYDKPLYEHVRWDGAWEILGHLRSESNNLAHQVHFLENHDEPRAVVAFGRERSMAAAVVMATLPGLHFYQDGQLEGKRVRIPVQLAREPQEFPDPEVSLLYRSLMRSSAIEALHRGDWHLIDVAPAWEGNGSQRNIVAWEWSLGSERVIVTVNYSAARSQAWVMPSLPGSVNQVVFEDVLTGTTYVRDPGELSRKGLYVDLGPYRSHIMHTAAY
jgi:hypothetical protein